MTIVRDGELDCQLTLLHGSRFRNKQIPVFLHILQDALEVRSEIHALRVAEYVERAQLPPMRAGAEAKVTLLPSASASIGSGRTGRLLNLGSRGQCCLEGIAVRRLQSG